MSWVTHDETYDDVIKEIERQPDRGAALVAAALLEAHLLIAIKAKLVSIPTVESKMFKGTGPLASFSAKIDMAGLLGLCPPTGLKTLHTIREIRNEFAHNIRPVTFKSQRIRDLCANLAVHRPSARVLLKDIKGNLEDGNIIFRIVERIVRPTSLPKKRYMKAIQLYLFFLSLGARLHEADQVGGNLTIHTHRDD